MQNKTTNSSKKHLTRDIDECLCNTDGVKREDLVYSLSDWKKLHQNQKCKKCIKEKEKEKREKEAFKKALTAHKLTP